MHMVFLLVALALGSAEVYRWVDADGQVHFSDRPHKGAERLVIEASPPSGVDLSAGRADAPPPLAGAESPGAYGALTVQSPRQDETVWNIEGQLDVTASVSPPIQPGHVLLFNLDGQVTAAPEGQSRARLSGVFRGEHSLRAEIQDPSGRTLIQSEPVRFYVRQTSIANPSAPRIAP